MDASTPILLIWTDGKILHGIRHESRYFVTPMKKVCMWAHSQRTPGTCTENVKCLHKSHGCVDTHNTCYIYTCIHV